MQIKALEYFEEAQRFDLALKANIRLTFLQHFPFLAQCFVTVVASKRCRTRQSVRQLAIFLQVVELAAQRSRLFAKERGTTLGGSSKLLPATLRAKRNSLGRGSLESQVAQKPTEILVGRAGSFLQLVDGAREDLILFKVGECLRMISFIVAIDLAVFAVQQEIGMGRRGRRQRRDIGGMQTLVSHRLSKSLLGGKFEGVSRVSSCVLRLISWIPLRPIFCWFLSLYCWFLPLYCFY